MMNDKKIEQFLVTARRWSIAGEVLEFIGTVYVTIAVVLLMWRGYIHFFH